MKTWGLFQRKSLTVPSTVTDFDWSNIANEWCANAELAASIATTAMSVQFKTLRICSSRSIACFAGNTRAHLWALNKLNAVPYRIDRDAYHDTSVSESARIASHRASSRLKGGDRRRHVLYVENHVRNRILQVVGIAMRDHDRLRS